MTRRPIVAGSTGTDSLLIPALAILVGPSLSRPPQSTPRFGPRVFPVLELRHSVHKDVAHSHGVPVWPGISRTVGNGFRIKDHHSGEISHAQQPAPVQPQVAGRQTGELANGLLQGQQLLLPNVLSQQPGEVPVSSRVRHRFDEYTFGRLRGLVRTKTHPRQ